MLNQNLKNFIATNYPEDYRRIETFIYWELYKKGGCSDGQVDAELIEKVAECLSSQGIKVQHQYINGFHFLSLA